MMYIKYFERENARSKKRGPVKQDGEGNWVVAESEKVEVCSRHQPNATKSIGKGSYRMV